MREALAFVRQDALTAASYRAGTVLSLGGLLFSVVPLYFVAGALQPVMARSIAGQGGEYFGFVLVGTIALRFATVGVLTLPGAIGSAMRTGTLEAVFATPVSLRTVLVGLSGYKVAWGGVEAVVLLLAGAALGARFALAHALTGVVILLLITIAYGAVGVLAGALLLFTRTTGPLLTPVLGASALLGGVYYPTHVIPSWIQTVSAVVPLTYGLRALRRTLLEGAPLAAVGADLATLAALAAALGVVSLYAFRRALRYAKHAGTLAQY